MKSENELSVEDAYFLAGLTRRTRDQPKEFTPGAKFIDSEFSYRAIRQRERTKLKREIAEGEVAFEALSIREHAQKMRIVRNRLSPTGSRKQLNAAVRREVGARQPPNPPWLRVARDKLAQPESMFDKLHGRFIVPRDRVLEWALTLTWDMSLEHALAAQLVAVFYYDSYPIPNVALGETLSKVPWGHPGNSTPAEFLRGRWIAMQMTGYPRGLVRVAQLAEARTIACTGSAQVKAQGSKRPRVRLKQGERLLALLPIFQQDPDASNQGVADRL